MSLITILILWMNVTILSLPMDECHYTDPMVEWRHYTDPMHEWRHYPDHGEKIRQRIQQCRPYSTLLLTNTQPHNQRAEIDGSNLICRRYFQSMVIIIKLGYKWNRVTLLNHLSNLLCLPLGFRFRLGPVWSRGRSVFRWRNRRR